MQSHQLKYPTIRQQTIAGASAADKKDISALHAQNAHTIVNATDSDNFTKIKPLQGQGGHLWRPPAMAMKETCIAHTTTGTENMTDSNAEC
jgi:hypothetical protein